jgi:hypothetical protein
MGYSVQFRAVQSASGTPPSAHTPAVPRFTVFQPELVRWATAKYPSLVVGSSALPTHDAQSPSQRRSMSVIPVGAGPFAAWMAANVHGGPPVTGGDVVAPAVGVVIEGEVEGNGRRGMVPRFPPPEGVTPVMGELLAGISGEIEASVVAALLSLPHAAMPIDPTIMRLTDMTLTDMTLETMEWGLRIAVITSPSAWS